jgi:hypothetical protein
VSRIKQMSRGGWILIGVIIAVLLYPSVANAASTVYDGIIGTSGHKADVSPTSQLLTAEAAPSSLYHFQGDAEADTVLATPPSGHALIVTSISVDFSSEAAPDFVELYVGSSSCGSSYKFVGYIDGATVWNGTSLVLSGGVEQVPVAPGISVPAADRLCGASGEDDNDVMISGYSVPSSTVTAPQVAHAVPKLRGH